MTRAPAWIDITATDAERSRACYRDIFHGDIQDNEAVIGESDGHRIGIWQPAEAEGPVA